MPELTRVGANVVRSRVLVGGTPVQFLRWSVELKGFGAASQATITLGMREVIRPAAGAVVPGRDPKAAAPTLPDILGDPNTIPTPLVVEIASVADPRAPWAGSLARIFNGYVDTARYRGREDEIELIGRDRTRLLIDTWTTEHWKGLKGSAIATLLAKKHGLTPIVPVPSKREANFAYQYDAVQMARGVREWDLLLFLARNDLMNVYVKGTELHYEPFLPPDQRTIYSYTWRRGGSSDVLEYTIEHSPLAAHDFIVLVKSHHPKSTQMTTQGVTILGETFMLPGTTSKAAGAYTGIQGTNVQSATSPRFRDKPTYEFHIDGLTSQQAADMAKSIAMQIALREYVLTVTVAGTTVVDFLSGVQIAGVHPRLDRVYFPQRIHHRYDKSGGFTTEIHALSHVPPIQTTVGAI